MISVNLKTILIILFLPLIIVLVGVTAIYLGINIAKKPDYITILHTNDIHGRLEPFVYRKQQQLTGGLARRASLIKYIESSNENVLTVDAGDFAQGTLFFNIFSGTPDVNLMSLAGYDVATLGNHEFDKGLQVTKNIVKQAKFPFVCANIRFTEDEELQSLVKPYIIRKQHGLKVAVIGLITENLKILANNLKNVEIFDPIETTRNIVKKINSDVDLIIVLSHEGILADIKLAKSVPEIDVIIGGHSHTLLKQPKIFNIEGDKTLVLQGGEFGVHLGRLDIKVKNKEVQSYYYDLITVDNEIKKDSYIENEIKILSKKIKKYKNQEVGEIAFTIGGKEDRIRSSLLRAGSLITEAIKYRFPTVDVVLQNSGGIRLYKHIPPGKMTLADVLDLYPFENKIVTLELKGSDLKSVLETSSRRFPEENGGFLQSSGLEYTLNSANPPQFLSSDGLEIKKEGQRVTDIKVNGVSLNPDKYYKIAINDYMFNGGNGFSQFKKANNVVKTGISIQDSIVKYIKENSPVSVKIKDKINFVKQ